MGRRTIGLFHGSPEDPDEYVMDESRAEELLRRGNLDVMVCGHTHWPMEIRVGERVFLNPGAVGQPRDNNPAASFCILDLATLKSSTKRIDYDVPSVQRDMLSKGLPRPLAERLSEGR
jgi:predicted phosphodiesterase